MKYVIFKYRSQYMPVIIPDHIIHSTIKIDGAELFSAGHFSFSPGGIKISTEQSGSLGIGPNIIDEKLLKATLANSEIVDFVHF